MIRLDDNIRLTATERSEMSGLLGFSFNPQTVAEHDATLLRAKADCDHVVASVQPEFDGEGTDESGAAEARLMSAVLQGMLIEA